MTNIVLTEQQLTALLESLADSFPMSAEEKAAWIEHCVLAELRGNIMQGLEHIGYHWFQRFTDGTTNWGATMQIVKETPAMAILDANGVMGALVAKRAMEIACERAKKSGVYTVAVRNSPDWMMIGYSTRQALKYDCVGWVYANSKPDVAPWGGVAKIYGHCLISAAIPTKRNYPLLMDMAANDTGGLAAQEQLMKGEMPKGLYYAPDGTPADDRPDLWGTDNINWGIKGGAQRMSGYRDLALTSVIDAFAGGITGMKLALDLDVPEPIVKGERPARGQVVMAFDIAQFTDVDAFKAKVDKAIDDAKASPLAPGFTEITMPGERGYREEERRRRHGVPIDSKVWREVVELAHKHGVDAVAVTGIGVS